MAEDQAPSAKPDIVPAVQFVQFLVEAALSRNPFGSTSFVRIRVSAEPIDSVPRFLTQSEPLGHVAHDERDGKVQFVAGPNLGGGVVPAAAQAVSSRANGAPRAGQPDLCRVLSPRIAQADGLTLGADGA
jgi:hypothetical protein